LTEFRYKAYISYSHADERWAAWLQRALETYRVPRRLSATGAGGSCPRSLAPVFRDREDLSSSRNLSEALVAALRASESLIVICSPSAAASKWVNEEVRQFQSLGRAKRVLCMIVDGDPDAEAGAGGCFPAALFDGVDDAGAVPLAADPRKFADGKKLAKLKLVAGLLGVRLDELRRRDLNRKRRWQAIGALAAAGALALAAVAVSSKIAQNQERAKAEQMATFIVELGEDLQSELDLESLGRISEQAMKYLEDLDPLKLSPETSIRVGQALRQVGLVNFRQGKTEQSLSALERSRQLFRDLKDKYPERQDMLFEFGQAEFYVGNYYYEQGDNESAWPWWQNYFDVAKALYDSDPLDRRWMLELSYASMNLMLLRIVSGRPVDQQLLDEAEENVRLAEQTLEVWPDNSEVLAHYSNVMAWAADAQLMACNLAEAERYRRNTVDQASRASVADRSNKRLRQYLAYRHTGLASVLVDEGNLEDAEAHRRASLDLLTGLLAMDPSNRLLSFDVAVNKALLAEVLRDTGRLETAVGLMQEAEPELRPVSSLEDTPERQVMEYARFLSSYVDLLWQVGDREGTLRALASLREILLTQGRGSSTEQEYRRQVAYLRHRWWQITGQDPAEQYPELRLQGPDDLPGMRSCSDAVAAAELAIIEGNTEAAQRQADYLATRGYRNPVYERFCQRHGLCSP